ncbi:MAG: chorismate-binding protein [Actinomycetota bacterium]|nr:chorismate-binding protein [Actinomycetota bacterium]
MAGPGAGSCLPGRDEFAALAREHAIVPVWRRILADTLTPVGAYMRTVGSGPGFLLESVEGGERWGRYSFVGRNALARLSARGLELSVEPKEGLAGILPPDRGILAALEALLDACRAPDLEGLPPLHGGVVGYLGYDVVREVERLGSAPEDDTGLPDASLFVIGQLCAFDHWRQEAVVLENVAVDPSWSGEEARSAFDRAASRLDDLVRDLYAPLCEPVLEPPIEGEHLDPSEVSRGMPSSSYVMAVKVAKEHIEAGDVFQVVLSQRFDFDLGADALDLYRVLRVVNPSPYLYFLRTPECTVVGASPEPLVRLRDGVVVSRPIAGTRPRGETPAEDALLAAELREHPKEIAEHVMLVDLARNDVGRVAAFGTETVDELMTLERYSHVMHLTSQVSARLAPGKGPADVLRATMPAGTLSGAPKVRAMQLIDELEPTKRGVYGGVVGYVDFSGNLDTAIAIRTMVVTPDGRAHVQAGAGVVADSDPEAEDRECASKAAALLAAVPAARRLSAARQLSEEAPG